LRLGRIAESRDRLARLAALDSRDHLGAAKLLEVVDEFQNDAANTENPSLNLAAA
jgi:hypothetical protein